MKKEEIVNLLSNVPSEIQKLTKKNNLAKDKLFNIKLMKKMIDDDKNIGKS